MTCYQNLMHALLVQKGDSLCSEAVSVREAGKVEHRQLQAKLEGVVDAVCFIPMALFSENKHKF